MGTTKVAKKEVIKVPLETKMVQKLFKAFAVGEFHAMPLLLHPVHCIMRVITKGRGNRPVEALATLLWRRCYILPL